MSAIDWPTPGSVWVDGTGRTLHVTAVQPKSRIGRHVVGYLDLVGSQRDYACDLPTFDLVWRERCVSAQGEEADYRPRQAYANGLPTGRTGTKGAAK